MQGPVTSSCTVRQSKNGGDNMKDQIVNSASLPKPSTNNYSTERSVDCGTSMNINGALTSTSTYLPNSRDGSIYQNTSTEEPCGPTAHISLHGKDVTNGAITRQLEDM
ncbi:TSL-kinase interacting protein, partial [Trifolium medium]|nr:TSL-kinase interacting protein [Trifolium medium]